MVKKLSLNTRILMACPLFFVLLFSSQTIMAQPNENDSSTMQKLQTLQTLPREGFFHGEFRQVVVTTGCQNGNTLEGTMSGTLSSLDGIHYSPTGIWQVLFDFQGRMNNCTPISHFYEGPASTDLQSGASHIVIVRPLGYLTYDSNSETISGVVLAEDEEFCCLQLTAPLSGFGPTSGTESLGEATASWTFNLVQNTPPTAEDQQIQIKKNKAAQISLSANDEDIGDTIIFSIVSQPSHGTITNFDESTGTLTYTPDKKFLGLDEFTFQATDSKGATSEIVTVSIAVGNKQSPSTTQDLDGFMLSIINLVEP